MNISAAKAPGSNSKTDCFVFFAKAKEKAGGSVRIPVPDAQLRKAATAALKAGEFQGKAGETLLLHGGDKGRRLLLVGTGAEGKKPPLPEPLRQAAGTAARVLDARGLGHGIFLVPSGAGAPERASAIGEGAGLALYRFERLKSTRDKAKLKRIVLAPERGDGTFTEAAMQASALVDAVSFARDLGNLPGNHATPVYLARQARELAGGKLSVRVHNRGEIQRLKMGAFAAVAQASHNEPRLIEFRYRGATADEPTLALVGKGVTFDTGGISIKPSAKMEEMKFDMCGAAAVFGLVKLVTLLKPRINLHALVPATDNMPGGAAYRPGDIVKARNGKTIEIISTDAEGRLLLCDALAYAAEKEPDCILDLATLTGACVVALADAACGLFGNEEGLVDEVRGAGEASGEIAWPMPIFPRYTEMMKSPYADLRNGGGRWGGACTAAAFLKEFVGDTPWVHLDIAGTAWTERDTGYLRRGATGFGVRLLWEFVKGRS
jgi:leucyl aminopeptidase